LVAAADRSEVSVFSDGSGNEGGIGAAAVLYRAGKRSVTKEIQWAARKTYGI